MGPKYYDRNFDGGELENVHFYSENPEQRVISERIQFLPKMLSTFKASPEVMECNGDLLLHCSVIKESRVTMVNDNTRVEPFRHESLYRFDWKFMQSIGSPYNSAVIAWPTLH